MIENCVKKSAHKTHITNGKHAEGAKMFGNGSFTRTAGWVLRARIVTRWNQAARFGMGTGHPGRQVLVMTLVLRGGCPKFDKPTPRCIAPSCVCLQGQRPWFCGSAPNWSFLQWNTCLFPIFCVAPLIHLHVIGKIQLIGQATNCNANALSTKLAMSNKKGMQHTND